MAERDAMSSEMSDWTAGRIADHVARKDVSAVEVVCDALDRIARVDGRIAAFHEVFEHEALEHARRVDRMIAEGTKPQALPLAGVPMAVKDNIATTLGCTTCGSRILESYRSPFDATAVKRLTDAGAIVIGRTNCDEFGMGSSTENCRFGATRNPWDTSRVPGGSSGGSAAAVAARLCPVALGSDTGGSVRQPAALCGIVGLKPTYGRVSRYGLVAFGSSLDCIGPMTRSVRDAAVLLQLTAGRDPHDATTADVPVPDYLGQLEEPINGLRIGVPRQYLAGQNEAVVSDAVRSGIKLLEQSGAEIIDIDLPLTDYGIATYYIIAPAEASSNLARYDGIRYGRRAELVDGETLADLYERTRSEGFGPEVKRRIMLGTHVLSSGYYDAYYKRAMQARRLIRDEFDRAFESCHAIIGPTSPITAFEIGAKPDPLTMYQCDVFTVNTNIAGICAMSIPAGLADAGESQLPIGVQLQCPAFAEDTLLRVARLIERATDHHLKRPSLIGGHAA
jgi:aspartyl-tRNA(Asn)/glutamyl-tRNA(Gln) amidotransferase subunit A